MGKARHGSPMGGSHYQPVERRLGTCEDREGVEGHGRVQLTTYVWLLDQSGAGQLDDEVCATTLAKI